MSTYSQTVYHIVFATKHREPVLGKAHRDDLYRFMWGCLQKRQCHLYRIGGVEDHVHILTSVHPSVSLANLVKEIKGASSTWMKNGKEFGRFSHWQDGYGAFTHSYDDRHGLIEYIKDQEAHHAKKTFVEELQALVEKAGMKWNPDYLP